MGMAVRLIVIYATSTTTTAVTATTTTVALFVVRSWCSEGVNCVFSVLIWSRGVELVCTTLATKVCCSVALVANVLMASVYC